MEDSQFNLDVIDMKIDNFRRNDELLVYISITSDGKQFKTKPQRFE